MSDNPLLFPYAQSTFEAQVPDSRHCDTSDVVRKFSERYPISLRSAPPPYAPDPELERACREDIASWLSQWILEHPAKWERGQAVAAHNEYVKLYQARGDDEAHRSDRQRLVHIVCPAVPWFFEQTDAALKEWALLHYVRHYTVTANADELRRDHSPGEGNDDRR
jgi:hypothetical protein